MQTSAPRLTLAAVVLTLGAAVALPSPAHAASKRRCATAKTAKVLPFYTLTLSVRRCWDGKRVSVTGEPKVTQSVNTVGAAAGWSFDTITATPAVRYGTVGSLPRGQARVTRSVRFSHCLTLPRLGCVLQLTPAVETIALRLYANGRAAGS